MMGIINKHLLARYSLMFLLVLFSLFGLVFSLGVADEVSRRVTENYTAWQATLYKLNTIPAELYQYIPLVFTLTVSIAVGSLAKSNELTIIRLMARNSFTILTRLLTPFLLFIPMVFYIGEFAAPQWANQAEVKRAELRGQTISQAETLWFTAGNWIGSAGLVDTNGNIVNLSLFDTESSQLKQIIMAETATAIGNSWQLNNATLTTLVEPQPMVTSYSGQRVSLPNVTPEVLARIGNSNEQLTLDKLANLAQYNQAQQVQDPALQVAFWSRIFVPLEIVTMIFLGLAFSMVSFRQRTIGDTVFKSLALGLGLGFVFDLLSGYLAIISLPAWLAVSAPLLLVLALFIRLTLKRL